MSVAHAGNVQPQLDLEEHEGSLNAKRVTLVGAAGQATITPVGLVTLAPSPNFIGIVTVGNTINANVSLSNSIANIGFATVRMGTNVNTNIGLVTVDGGRIGILGNVTLSNSNTYIGLTTTTLGIGDRFIGLVTVGNTINANVSLGASQQYIGLTTTQLGLGDRFIGLVTNVQAGLTTLAPSPNAIGFVTVAGMADPKTYVGLMTTTLGLGDRFIGLATVVLSGQATVLTRNAGTNKALKILPIAFATSSAATVVVPTNTFHITSILLNSNATVRLNIRSGATYLTGNATLGINISPLSGWVETGTVDSPIYEGLAAQAPIVIEKFDAGGIISQIGGKVVYFDE